MCCEVEVEGMLKGNGSYTIWMRVGNNRSFWEERMLSVSGIGRKRGSIGFSSQGMWRKRKQGLPTYIQHTKHTQKPHMNQELNRDLFWLGMFKHLIPIRRGIRASKWAKLPATWSHTWKSENYVAWIMPGADWEGCNSFDARPPPKETVPQSHPKLGAIKFLSPDSFLLTERDLATLIKST